MGRTIADQIDKQMSDATINELSGLKFIWWAIWNKRTSSRWVAARTSARINQSILITFLCAHRMPRSKREAEEDLDENYDDYYDDGETKTEPSEG